MSANGETPDIGCDQCLRIGDSATLNGINVSEPSKLGHWSGPMSANFKGAGIERDQCLGIIGSETLVGANVGES